MLDTDPRLPETSVFNDPSWQQCIDYLEEISCLNPVSSDRNVAIKAVSIPIFQEGEKDTESLIAEAHDREEGATKNVHLVALTSRIDRLNATAQEIQPWPFKRILDTHVAMPYLTTFDAGTGDPVELMRRVREVQLGRGSDDRLATFFFNWFSVSATFKRLMAERIKDPSLLFQFNRLKVHPLFGGMEKNFRLEAPREMKYDPAILTVNQVLDDLWTRTKEGEFAAAEIGEEDVLTFLRSARNDALRIELEPSYDLRMMKLHLSGYQSPHVIERLIRAIENHDFSHVDPFRMQDIIYSFISLITHKSMTVDSKVGELNPTEDQRYYRERMEVVLKPLIGEFIKQYIFPDPEYMAMPEYEDVCTMVGILPKIPEIPGLNVNELVNRALTLHDNMMKTVNSAVDPNLTYQIDNQNPNCRTESVINNEFNGLETEREYHYFKDTLGTEKAVITVSKNTRKAVAKPEDRKLVKFTRERLQNGEFGNWQIEIQIGDRKATWRHLSKHPDDPEIQNLLKEFGLIDGK